MTSMTQSDYIEYSKEIAEILASAVSTAFSEVYSQWQGQTLSMEQKYALNLEAFEKSYAFAAERISFYDGVYAQNPVFREMAQAYKEKWSSKAAALAADIRPVQQRIANLDGQWRQLADTMEKYAAGNSKVLALLGPALDVLQLGIGAIDFNLNGDPTKLQEAVAGIACGMMAAAAVGAITVGLGIGLFALPFTVLAAVAGNAFGEENAIDGFDGVFAFLDKWQINPLVGIYADTAFTKKELRDPLALDLNNDGIATISANDGIMFDHNNAGIRYGTGWINPSDGWLALDRNGNGAIDSGRELFGDSTKKLDGNFAAHAYDALASFDTNKDGKVDVADATGDADSSGAIDGAETYWDIDNNGTYNADKDKTFADLRVWVDANSNVNTFKGNYTTGSGEVIDGARSFNLVENKFHREEQYALQYAA